MKKLIYIALGTLVLTGCHPGYNTSRTGSHYYSTSNEFERMELEAELDAERQRADDYERILMDEQLRLERERFELAELRTKAARHQREIETLEQSMNVAKSKAPGATAPESKVAMAVPPASPLETPPGVIDFRAPKRKVARVQNLTPPTAKRSMEPAATTTTNPAGAQKIPLDIPPNASAGNQK